MNRAVWAALPRLTGRYNVFHVCGRGKGNPALENGGRYRQAEFVEDIGPLYALADLVVTRSGSNAVCECLALGKRMLCIPLSRAGSRGEQLQNARFAEQYGGALVLEERDLHPDTLESALEALLAREPDRRLRLRPGQLEENCRALLAAIEAAAGIPREKRESYTENAGEDRESGLFR